MQISEITEKISTCNPVDCNTIDIKYSWPNYGLSLRQVPLDSGDHVRLIIDPVDVVISWRDTKKVRGQKYYTKAGAYPGFSEGGVPRSAKEANKPNKLATELKSHTCARQGSMFRPY